MTIQQPVWRVVYQGWPTPREYPSLNSALREWIKIVSPKDIRSLRFVSPNGVRLHPTAAVRLVIDDRVRMRR